MLNIVKEFKEGNHKTIKKIGFNDLRVSQLKKLRISSKKGLIQKRLNNGMVEYCYKDVI